MRKDKILIFLESLLNNSSNEQDNDLQDIIDAYQHNIKRLGLIIKQSDRQQAELIRLNEELDQYKNHLEQKVQEEIAKNQEKETILLRQTKLASMGEMISNISHQFKQPLSVLSMIGNNMQLDYQLDTADSKNFEIYAEHILDQVDYLSQTIDDFKNFFSPIKEKKDFNIKEIIKKIDSLFQAQFKNNNIEVIEVIENIKLKTFENELLQILINILKNAKDEFSKTEDMKRKLIFIDITSKEDDLIIKIKDNAGGIPTDIIDKIFDSHFTTKEKTGGTGIGLYMCKQIAEEHLNGRLYAYNSEYEYDGIKYTGAEFVIHIPLI